MEEYSHLGLDDEAARKLREIIVRQIDDARAGPVVQPEASSDPAPSAERLPTHPPLNVATWESVSV